MSTTAWFRFAWEVADGSTRIFGPSPPTIIRDRPRTTGEVLASHSNGAEGWSVVVTSELQVGAASNQALRAIAERRVPDDSNLSADEPGNVQRWLDHEMSSFVITVLDVGIQTEIDAIRDDLSSEGRRFFELLRWVTDSRTSARPLRRGRLEFSFDGDTWVRAPVHPPGKPIGLRVDWGIRLDEIDWDEFSALASRGCSEPVGHSLIREAFALRADSPRSSIVLAAAAAETAVKEAVHRLAPDATYLVDEMSTPPIARLVRDYLPTLRSAGSDPSMLMPIPSELRRSIHWLAETRNRVVHNREQRHTFPGLLEALLHIQDLVWILDYHCGHEWALLNVSQPTLALGST